MSWRLATVFVFILALLSTRPALAELSLSAGLSWSPSAHELGIHSRRMAAFYTTALEGTGPPQPTHLTGLEFAVADWEKAQFTLGAMWGRDGLSPRVSLNLGATPPLAASLGLSAQGIDYRITLSAPVLGERIVPYVKYQRWPKDYSGVMVGMQVSLFTTSSAKGEQNRPPGSAPNSPAEPRHLIVNADDLGLSDGVTEGIVTAWQDGVVTSTSALVNIDGAMDRIVAAHRAHPDMPIGLHLNITLGRPVLPPHEVPTLVDANGQFHSPDRITTHLLSISLDELRAELRAQAELLRSHGVPISHLDYHHHMVALYAPFYGVVRKLAAELGVPVRQPVPESVYGHVKFPGKGGTAAVIWKMVSFGLRHPIMAIRLMPNMTPAAYKAQAKRLAEEGIRAPDWFVDAYFAHATVENFIRMLEQLPPGVSEVAVHPAIVDAQLRELDPEYAEARAGELAVLLDPRVREAFGIHGVEPVSYSVLKSVGGPK